jgi:hypothetical protein
MHRGKKEYSCGTIPLFTWGKKELMLILVL